MHSGWQRHPRYIYRGRPASRCSFLGFQGFLLVHRCSFQAKYSNQRRRRDLSHLVASWKVRPEVWKKLKQNDLASRLQGYLRHYPYLEVVNDLSTTCLHHSTDDCSPRVSFAVGNSPADRGCGNAVLPTTGHTIYADCTCIQCISPYIIPSSP